MVSIIVPVYNTKKEVLEVCLRSLSSQTYSDIEIIIIDDGSVEEIKEALDLYALGEPRCTVVHTRNQGVAMARNEGIRRASGKYACFVDSDDWIKEDFIQVLLDNIEENDLVVLPPEVHDDFSGQTIKKERKSQLMINCEKVYVNNLLAGGGILKTVI